MKKGFMVVTVAVMFSLAASICLAGDITVGGGGAAISGFIEPFVEPFETEFGIKVVTKQSTPAQGLIQLHDGHINVAVSATSLDVMVEGAAMNGITIDPAQFEVRKIGMNKTLVFVNKNNKVKKLSKKQLQGIFTGKIKNWKRVGGPDLPVLVVWGTATPGQNELFVRQILDGIQVTQEHIEATDYKNIRAIVAKTPGAIGIDPQGFASIATWNPQIPVVSAPVIAVTKGAPSAEVDKFLEYVKNYF